ncbi:MAG: hypothetical protein RLZZ175_55 [Bacteroidota bacterium]|jgi:hypothetical protein
MKINISLIFCLCYNILVFGQSNINEVQMDFETKLKKVTKNTNWKIESFKNEIQLKYYNTFFINTILNPLNNRNGILNKPDSIVISFKFENNWNQSKSDSIQKFNLNILNPIKERIFSYYDSTKWSGVMSNRTMFLNTPLKHSIILGNKNDKNNLSKIIRLPDLIINNVGIFIDTDYIGYYVFIEPEVVEIEVNNFHKKLEEILGKGILSKIEINY